ncbi:MarR family winged helix-turn-helix transcriptional regulator [Glycomyces paridis]|uniref:MarR family transcriptional regulator n=1 Tax=Glycomyces paridis TaxID=2126555 RepID=A0A4S8NTL3_9ACTN|nr:MarR family transcriptional regulator [Glycomyces paridis]THV20840.1 MarR family transcriptional regulator [Glycomyces paridis]
MEQTPARLAGKPTWLVTQLAVHAHRLSSEGFAEVGARGYHYRILSTLDEFGGSSQADLGRRSNMDRSDVVAAVNQLADLGFVERTPDPADRRRNIVTLTEAGARQLDRLDEVLGRAQDELLAPLAEEERATLVRLLTRTLEHHRNA